MGHGAGLAGLERQSRLRAVESLDLGLLVDREHDRVARWSEVETDNVRELGGELGVAAALEGADAMRLQLVGCPDPLHRPQRQAGDLRHHPPRPVARLPRRLGAGQHHHALHLGLGCRRLVRLSGLVAQQPVDAGLGIAKLPAPDRRPAEPRTPGNLRHLQSLRRCQDDAGSHRMFLRPVAIGQNRRQTLAIRRRNPGTNYLCHDQAITQSAARMNLKNASEH